ncbi:MAG: hypothetical protein KIT74_01900 [Fimbriimonadales bacterium]|nr:hypothetical protein [Fimbriimonadales bacterium]
MNSRFLSSGSPWLVLGWMAILGIAGFLLATVLPKKFEAQTALMFPQTSQADTNTGRAILSPFQRDREGASLMGGQIFLPTIGTSPNSLIDLLTSRSASEIVANKNSQELFGGPPTDRQIEELQEAIRFEVTENGNLKVFFSHSSRAVASKVVTDLLEYCDLRVRELTKEFAAESLDFLNEEVARRQSEVGERTEALSSALYRSPLGALTGAKDQLANALVQANATIRNLEVNLEGANAAISTAIGALRKARDAGAEGDAYSELMADLKVRVTDIKNRLNRASSELSETSPEMRRLRDELRAISKTYTDELDAMVEAAEKGSLSLTLSSETRRAEAIAQVRKMRSQVSRLRAEALELADLEIEHRLLTRDLERAESQLDLAVSQLAMARIAEQKRYKPFVILDPVFASDRPAFPKRGLFTAGGIGLGLLIGLFFYIRALGRALGGDAGESDG